MPPRPHYSVLGSRRGQLLPSLDDALARYFRDLERDYRPAAANIAPGAHPQPVAWPPGDRQAARI
ncbi:MAG TPA: hypothetical protein VM536_00705 [Chloroflexia bacterium]|nr:hypothetical protein [Chloroflexia bacterium]